MNTFGGVLWTAAEIGVLRAMHPTHTSRQIGALLERSKSSVEHKTQALDLRKSPRETTIAEDLAADPAEWRS